jgi:hypothetical protein
MTTKWTSFPSGTGPGITAAIGRWGTSAMRCAAGAQNRGVTKVLDAQATWILGGAIKIGAAATANFIFRVMDGAVVHVELRWDSAGHLFVTRGGTTLATGTTVLTPGVFYFVELKATISDTVGVAVVRIDGAVEINFSGDTRNAGNATADRFDVGTISGSNVQLDVDDFYACDGTGSAPTNDFLGDVRVEALLPNGNGTTSNLVGSDGNSVDNYLLVDDATPAVADYVESSTVGDKDTYAFTNPTPSSGTVYGVQVLPYAAKTDAGVRSIVSVARLAGTEVDSSAKTLSATAQYLPDVREAKPGGGSWSVSDVGSAEFGVKVNA